MAVSGAEALAEADTLVCVGRHLDAIELLTRANRRARSTEVDRRLVRLRHEAFPQIEPRRRAAWPPALPDPRPHSADLVEIGADALTPEILGGAIVHHGSVLVRGLLPRRIAAHLAEQTDLAFDAQERWRERVESNASEGDATEPWFEPFSPDPRYAIDPLHLPLTRMNRDAYRVLFVDSPPLMFDVLDALELAGVRGLLTAYLGERPVMTVSRSLARRLPLSPQRLGWHQDAATFGRAAPSVNCWVALGDCGDVAPGIEVLPFRVDDIVATPGNQGLARGDIPLAPCPEPLRGVAPIFAAGDALMFDDLLVHRTSMNAHMTETRYSMENWFFTAKGLPAKNAPIVF